MNNSIETLANRINTFNTQYAMTSIHAKYQAGRSEDNRITASVESLNESELIELASLIEDESKRKYFRIPAPAPKPVNEEPSTKSVIFSNAWTMFKAELFETFGEALAAAWKRSKLVAALKTGVAYFSFTKADGTVRESIGTLRDGNFEYVAKGPKKESKIEIVKYYDINSKGWRSCRVDRLLSVAA